MSGSLNFLATSLLSYSSFLAIEKKKMTKNLNNKLEALGIKQKLLISNDGSDESDKSAWQLKSHDVIMNDKLLLKELDIENQIILELNNMIIQQDDQIKYYKQMLGLLQESVNSIKIFLDDEN